MPNNICILPSKTSLKRRSSTITNAFAHSLDPRTAESVEKQKLLEISIYLDVVRGSCAYCLMPDSARIMDHFHAVVKDKKPTGYFTELNNLIPCCKECNSRKGGKDFFDWYNEDETRKWLRSRGMSDEDIQHRLEVFYRYDKEHPATKIPYEKVFGTNDWEALNKKIEDLNKQIADLDDSLAEYRNKIKDFLNNK